MTDKEFEAMRERKYQESLKPGYGARCAAKAAKVYKARAAQGCKRSAKMLILS